MDSTCPDYPPEVVPRGPGRGPGHVCLVRVCAPGREIPSAVLEGRTLQALKYSFFGCKLSVLDARSRFKGRKGY
uniref:Uncharacterized protein n=2 Tax=Ursus TaxID=9639 RepID=A0A452T791_URSMA